MEATRTIFSATIKENKHHPELLKLVKELTFELSRKKIQRLKDEKNIHNRLGELFELYCKVLHSEGLKTPKAVGHVIDGLLKACSHDKEEFLYKTIYEKEQLEKSILNQKQHIRNSIGETFTILENHIANIMDDTKEAALMALHDAKLKGLEMLGILKETTTEALLTTLEKGTDVKDTAYEITKNLTLQTINEGSFTKQRILDISSTIISAGIELADEDFGHAKDILEGTVHGVKDGISKAIDKFKNDLKYVPIEEIEGILETDPSLLKKDLAKIDEELVTILYTLASQTEGVSSGIIKEMATAMNSSTAKIKRAAHEAKEVIAERMEELKIEAFHLEKNLKDKAEKSLEVLKRDVNEFEKIASAKVESLRHFEFENDKAKHVATEAKKLGLRAWEVAKHMVDNAVKSAKDTIK
jgi:hypothetical protein